MTPGADLVAALAARADALERLAASARDAQRDLRAAHAHVLDTNAGPAADAFAAHVTDEAGALAAHERLADDASRAAAHYRRAADVAVAGPFAAARALVGAPGAGDDDHGWDRRRAMDLLTDEARLLPDVRLTVGDAPDDAPAHLDWERRTVHVADRALDDPAALDAARRCLHHTRAMPSATFARFLAGGAPR